MRRFVLALMCCMICTFMACSLPPERPITKEQLNKTGIYNMYTIKESPDRVLAALNSEGEVVLEALQRNVPVYVKILATNSGLKVYPSER